MSSGSSEDAATLAGDDNDARQDQLRIRIAWVITGVWACGFPLAVVLPTFPVTWAQAPMMAVVGWLFAGPLIRRNGNGGP